MSKVIVYVGGGMVQDIVTDSEGIEVMIVDYDVEKMSDDSDRVFETARRDISQINLTVNGKERPIW